MKRPIVGMGYAYGLVLIGTVLAIGVFSLNEFYQSLTKERGQQVAKLVVSRARMLEEIHQNRTPSKEDLAAMGVGAEIAPDLRITFDIIRANESPELYSHAASLGGGYVEHDDLIEAYAPLPKLNAFLRLKFDMAPTRANFRKLLARISVACLILLILGAMIIRYIERHRDQRSRLRDEGLEREISRLNMFKEGLDAHFMLSVTDREGKFLEVNDRFCSISGYRREELLNRNFSIFNSGEHDRTYFNNFWNTILEGRVWHGNNKNIGRDGDYFWVDTTVVPVTDPERDESYFVCIQADITDKQQYEERLLAERKKAEDASNQKSLFLAHMSHEIRSPLSSIIGYAELIDKNNVGDTQAWDYLGRIKKNANHLLELIGGILDFSKIEAGELEISKTVIPLLPEIDAVAHLYDKEARVPFNVNLMSPLPEVIYTDAVRMRQILINLLNNAFKFTEKGHVELRVRMSSVDLGEPRRKLIFEVEDTGQGVAKDFVDRLFMPFNQHGEFHSRVTGGTGLGLALSRELAQALGGDLVYVRRQNGLGATFKVTIDPGDLSTVRMVSQFPERLNRHEGQREKAPLLAGVRILLVEDNDDISGLVSLQLGRAGAQITPAKTGEEALRQLRESKFDIVLLDIQLPKMSGYDVIGKIHEAKIEIPIIALTAHSTRAERDKCLAAGFSDFFSKPVEFSKLIESIRKWYMDTGTGIPNERPMLKPLYSALADDELSRPALEKFVSSLDEKIRGCFESFQDENWTELEHKSHQLKGAFATFGFPELKDAAAKIEDNCAQSEVTGEEKLKISESLGTMTDLSERARIAFEQDTNA